ncbi:MAG: hypothetical protein A2049_08590 [Elusimicrobia bacterium GWA2_62_23]|nr:MAG: hypothetical protein A2049_08590 [Elusimicrobia bacterium GWA2_62_23]
MVLRLPGIEYLRSVFSALTGMLAKSFLWILLVSGLLFVAYVESGWKTVIIKDPLKPQTFRLHSIFSVAPVSLRIEVVGNMDGKFSLSYGEAVNDTHNGENIEAKGSFLKVYAGDWYDKCYLRYVPIDVKMDGQDRVGEIRVHYAYVDAWDYLAFFFGFGTLN